MQVASRSSRPIPTNPMLFVTGPGRACAEAVLRAVSRYEEKTLAEIHDAVLNDYGTVTLRTVSRYLSIFARRGVIAKMGEATPHLYTRKR